MWSPVAIHPFLVFHYLFLIYIYIFILSIYSCIFWLFIHCHSMQYVNIKSLRYSLIFVLGFTAQYSTICTYTSPPPPYLIHPSCCSSMSLYPWQTYSEGFINKMVRFHLDGDEKKEDAIVVRVYRDAMEVSPNREKELLCMQVSVPLQWRRMDVMAFELHCSSRLFRRSSIETWEFCVTVACSLSPHKASFAIIRVKHSDVITHSCPSLV